MYKGLVLLISSFVAISSFTVSQIKLCAMISFAIDVITCYFIFILYPEIDRMKRTITIVTEKNKNSKPEKTKSKNIQP